MKVKETKKCTKCYGKGYFSELVEKTLRNGMIVIDITYKDCSCQEVKEESLEDKFIAQTKGAWTEGYLADIARQHALEVFDKKATVSSHLAHVNLIEALRKALEEM